MTYEGWECPIEGCEVVICNDPTCDCRDHDHTVPRPPLQDPDGGRRGD